MWVLNLRKETGVRKGSVEAILLEDKALLEGHFLLRSGMHSPRYLQCAKVLQYPKHAEKLAKLLAKKLAGVKVDVVVGPAIGGIIVAQELARALGARSIFSEREEDVFRLRRDFEISKGEKAVIAENVITTGGAAQEVLDLVAGMGADVVAVATLVNRAKQNPFRVPYHYLYNLDAPTWSAAECPLCKEGKPLVKPGSREVRK
jgi:orotate phosphoribosyltransferase